MEFLIGAIIVIVIAILFLKGFDKIAGKGPKQIKDGINKSSVGGNEKKRIS